MSPAFVDNDGNVNWRKVGYHARSAFAVLLSLAILVGGGWFVYDRVNTIWTEFRTADDYVGEGKDPVAVVVPMGATLTQIGDILVANDVVKSTKTFRDEASKNPDSATIQAGRYNLLTELPAVKALEMLLDPANQEITSITIREGLTLSQQWTVMETQLGLNRADISEAVNSEGLNLPAWANGKVEGFMFPDTYRVAEPAAALPLVREQASQFTRITTNLDFETRAGALGMAPYDVVTVASIIEREVGQADYRALVSSVIHNRLAQNMPLQMDSTVHYALGDYSKVTTTAEDRQIDSPYNTYKYSGLPPGAISNPGAAALEAAVAPVDTDYLFFVTVDLDTGETRFAATLAEHEANVTLFQQWCQANTGRC